MLLLKKWLDQMYSLGLHLLITMTLCLYCGMQWTIVCPTSGVFLTERMYFCSSAQSTSGLTSPWWYTRFTSSVLHYRQYSQSSPRYYPCAELLTFSSLLLIVFRLHPRWQTSSHSLATMKKQISKKWGIFVVFIIIWT